MPGLIRKSLFNTLRDVSRIFFAASKQTVTEESMTKNAKLSALPFENLFNPMPLRLTLRVSLSQPKIWKAMENGKLSFARSNPH